MTKVMHQQWCVLTTSCERDRRHPFGHPPNMTRNERLVTCKPCLVRRMLDEELNDVVLDLYDLTIANAPLSAGDQRALADDIGRHIGDAKARIASKVSIRKPAHKNRK